MAVGAGAHIGFGGEEDGAPKRTFERIKDVGVALGARRELGLSENSEVRGKALGDGELVVDERVN